MPNCRIKQLAHKIKFQKKNHKIKLRKKKVSDTLDKFSHVREIMKLQYGNNKIFFYKKKIVLTLLPILLSLSVTLYHRLRLLPLTLLHILLTAHYIL